MAINCYSFPFLLFSVVLHLFFFASCSLEKVEAYRFVEMTTNHELQTRSISLSSLMPGNVCSTPAEGSNISSKFLQVTHEYGPCSPLKERKSKIPNLHQILIDNQTRVKSINSRISNQHSKIGDSIAKLPVRTIKISENFAVKIGFGKPEQRVIVEFDTGSDLTWIQCLPCKAKNCYLQQDPYFNSSASSTYSNIPCHSKACSQLNPVVKTKSSCTTNCPFEVSYADGSYSQGYLATDTLTLSSSDASSNFVFGCGHENQGLFGAADGLLGLACDQISMISQTAPEYKKLFPYCLLSSTNFTGFLAFGSQAATSSSNAQYTPLLTNSKDPSSYFLNMTGISVGGKKLSIAKSVFTTSGTTIDSGTVITQLAPSAYAALQSAFHRAMHKYQLVPSPSELDTCYNLSGYNTVEVPTIVLHFEEGTNLNVDDPGILIQRSSTRFCLAFRGNSAPIHLGILGIHQQLKFEVIYNVAAGKLGFGAGACN